MGPCSSNMEFFVTLVNGWKPLTNVAKNSIVDTAGVLDIHLSFYIKVITKTKDEIDDFLAYLFVKLLSYNLVYKQKDNKKHFCAHFNFKVVKLILITFLY